MAAELPVIAGGCLSAAGQIRLPNHSPRRNLPFVICLGLRPLCFKSAAQTFTKDVTQLSCCAG